MGLMVERLFGGGKKRAADIAKKQKKKDAKKKLEIKNKKAEAAALKAEVAEVAAEAPRTMPVPEAPAPVQQKLTVAERAERIQNRQLARAEAKKQKAIRGAVESAVESGNPYGLRPRQRVNIGNIGLYQESKGPFRQLQQQVGAQTTLPTEFVAPETVVKDMKPGGKPAGIPTPPPPPAGGSGSVLDGAAKATEKAAAEDAAKGLSRNKKLALLAAGTAAVGGLGYMAYRNKRQAAFSNQGRTYRVYRTV